MDYAKLELEATTRRFEEVCSQWRLTPDETSILVDPAMLRQPVLIERRKRLLIELDELLRCILGSERVSGWLRTEVGGGPDPLTLLVVDDAYLPAMLGAARSIAER